MEKIFLIGLLISILGYLLGSILFAPFFVSKIRKIEIEEVSKDGNPGTANAFLEGGFICGILTLFCDIGKGFLPVYLYLQMVSNQTEFQKYIGIVMIFVMISPVVGHAYSVFHHFEGGKCIAVSFGVLIGLLPEFRPLLILAFCYILFSILKIQPHGKRTFVAFISACILDFLILKEKIIVIGMGLITGIVIRKHFLNEKRQLERKKKVIC